MEFSDDVKFLLDLKFNTVEDVVKAFKEAIDAPQTFAHDPGIRQEVLMKAVTMWAMDGAPKKFDITEDNVDLIIQVKFGSLQRAYNYWTMMVDPGTQNNLSDLEYQRIVDYVPKG